MARQNGKNGIIEIRELAGMVLRGEKFLHTAHEVKTARKAFIRLASFFDNPRQYPELAELVKEIRRTNGQEAIVLSNGGSCEFIARSKGSGRGFTVDVLVMDEAQELSEDSLAALLPTISASPLGNPQQIYTGTPPGPTMNGEVFTRVRRAGMEGTNPRLAWTDYGVEGPLPNVDDRKLWHRTNPALGGRLNIETVIDERTSMSDETFARERLGWWGDPEAGSSAIPLGPWADCMDVESKFGPGPTALGVYITGDRSTAFIAAVGQRTDGLVHVEILRAVAPHQAVAVLKEMQEKRRAPVVIDPGSHAGSLIQPLEEAGIEVLRITLQEISSACGTLYDLIVEKNLRHIGQAPLDEAVETVEKRVTTRDAWAWKGPLSSPLMAVTFALHGFGQADSGDGFNIW